MVDGGAEQPGIPEHRCMCATIGLQLAFRPKNSGSRRRFRKSFLGLKRREPENSDHNRKLFEGKTYVWSWSHTRNTRNVL